MDDLRTRPESIAPFAERTARRRAADQDVDARLRRRLFWQLGVASLVLLVLGVLAYRSWFVSNEADPELSAAVDELRSQVRGLGGTPVVPPAEDITGDETNVVPIPGPEGPRGFPGPIGPPGRDGRTGEPCQPSNPECIGPPGPPGPSGPEGDTGLPGGSGEPGATGATGEPGPAGPTGAIGPEGPAGPAGVSVTNVTVVEVDNNECHLIVTLSDGSQIDAGAVDCPTPPLLPEIP
jgi:hypothetical protein